MDQVDIRSCIFKHINNVKDLFNLCIVDKQAIIIASTKFFWIEQFMKFGLPKPSITFNIYHEWKNEFLQCKNAMDRTNDIMNGFKDDKLRRCEIDQCISLHKYITILKQNFCYNFETYTGRDMTNIKMLTIFVVTRIRNSRYVLSSLTSWNEHHVVDINTDEQLKNILYDIYKEK